MEPLGWGHGDLPGSVHMVLQGEARQQNPAERASRELGRTTPWKMSSLLEREPRTPPSRGDTFLLGRRPDASRDFTGLPAEPVGEGMRGRGVVTGVGGLGAGPGQPEDST